MDLSINRQEFWKNIKSSYYFTNWDTAPDRRMLIGQIAKNNNVKSILELGCHDGVNLFHILNKCPDVRACGIDICENAIKQGKDIHKNPAELIVGSIYDLSMFENQTFDVVFTSGVLMHIQEEKCLQIISEMARIAKYHTFHFEMNGKPTILSYGDNEKKIPHTMVHSYTDLYSNIKIEANVLDVTALKIKDKGCARHIIWTNLSDRNMVIEPFKGQ